MTNRLQKGKEEVQEEGIHKSKLMGVCKEGPPPPQHTRSPPPTLPLSSYITLIEVI